MSGLSRGTQRPGLIVTCLIVRKRWTDFVRGRCVQSHATRLHGGPKAEDRFRVRDELQGGHWIYERADPKFESQSDTLVVCICQPLCRLVADSPNQLRAPLCLAESVKPSIARDITTWIHIQAKTRALLWLVIFGEVIVVIGEHPVDEVSLRHHSDL
ncbi:hypothetical protein HYQ46_006642 [Verticillium longisporum]|nr:hypothetical protein HYQ46_006642 [Verticillium longisporum]